MNTIAEQLALLADTKTRIKAAIEAKGVTVGDAPFADYTDKITQIQSGEGGEDYGDFSDFESLAIAVYVHNESKSITIDDYNNAYGIIDNTITPGRDGRWFYESMPDYFDIEVIGSQSRTFTGKCYIKNGDVVSATQPFSELGGDYFSVYWDKGPFDLKQKIEIYLFD